MKCNVCLRKPEARNFPNCFGALSQFAKEGWKYLRFFLSNVSTGNVTLHRGLQVASKLRVAQAHCMSLVFNIVPHVARRHISKLCTIIKNTYKKLGGYTCYHLQLVSYSAVTGLALCPKMWMLML